MSIQLPKIPIIETKRLRLRPITIDDAADLFAYAQQPATAQYVFWNEHQSIADSQQFIKTLLSDYQTSHKQMWAIALKTTNQLIGTCGFMAHYPITKMLELGYVLNPNYWRMGYTSEALKAIIHYAFTKLDIIRIEGICVAENAASAKTMQHCHLQFEGLLHDAFIKNNKIYNCHLYAITKRQYESMK